MGIHHPLLYILMAIIMIGFRQIRTLIDVQINRFLNSKSIANLSHNIETAIDNEEFILLQELEFSINRDGNRVTGNIFI